MNNQKKKKYRWILMSVLILIVLVAATTIVLAERMTGYYLDDSGAIPITNEIQSMEQNSVPVQQQTEPEPEFGAEDVEGEWTTNTKVDIFRISYQNGENVVTVNSGDGEKVIAPGTENAYSFKLKNTGNVDVEYEMNVNAYITPEGTPIPVQARVSRYDGTWIAGSKDNYVDVLNLSEISDKATLGAGRYTYYTLDWKWPFEQGDDAADTELGNLAASEDLVLTIEITTNAWADYDPDDNKGIISPQTGDDMNTSLWIAIGVCMLLMMLLLIFTRKREDEEEEETRA